jgi:hypothetical protein
MHDEEKPTLRDQFAMAALPAVVSNNIWMQVLKESANKSKTSISKEVTTIVWKIADAMLEARKKEDK